MCGRTFEVACPSKIIYWLALKSKSTVIGRNTMKQSFSHIQYNAFPVNHLAEPKKGGGKIITVAIQYVQVNSSHSLNSLFG